MKKFILACLLFFMTTLPALAGTTTVVNLCERSYRLYIPTGIHANAPLVISLHPGTSNALFWQTLGLGNSLNTMADSNLFMVAYPAGTESIPATGSKTWNAGWCCGYAASTNQKDVQFIHALIHHVAENHSIDTSKVYMTGYSNGALLAYRYICTYPADVAGMVVAAATLVINHTQCAASVPVPIVHIYGLSDTNIPPAGGFGTGISGVYFPPLADTQSFLEGRGASFTFYPLTGVDHDFTNIQNGLSAQYNTSFAALVGNMTGVN